MRFSSSSRITSWLISSGTSASNRSRPSATKSAICTDVSRHFLSSTLNFLHFLQDMLEPQVSGAQLHAGIGRMQLWELDDPPAVPHGGEHRLVGRRIAVPGRMMLLAGAVVECPGADLAVEVGRPGIENENLLPQVRHEHALLFS